MTMIFPSGFQKYVLGGVRGFLNCIIVILHRLAYIYLCNWIDIVLPASIFGQLYIDNSLRVWLCLLANLRDSLMLVCCFVTYLAL